jgi:diguanylate cyclase (GGDEF)-like protein/PAS domain S-box-containing protein
MLEFLVKNKKATQYTLDYLLSYYRVLFEKNPAAIFVVDKKRNLIDVNPAVQRLLGYTKEELIGRNALILHPNEKSYHRQQSLFEKILNEDIVITFERSLKRKDGQLIWTQMTACRVLLPENELGVMWSAVDSTEFYKLRKKLEYTATHDYLTGLYNRNTLEYELERLTIKAKRTKQKVMICILDLDDFKRINDSFGHQTGDELLKEVAKRLKNSLRGSDFISRYGGDEFVLIFENVKNANSVNVILSKIDKALKKPINLKSVNKSTVIDYSMGIYIYTPSSDVTYHKALRFADIALYKSKSEKKTRKENWCFYNTVNL